MPTVTARTIADWEDKPLAARMPPKLREDGKAMTNPGIMFNTGQVGGKPQSVREVIEELEKRRALPILVGKCRVEGCENRGWIHDLNGAWLCVDHLDLRPKPQPAPVKPFQTIVLPTKPTPTIRRGPSFKFKHIVLEMCQPFMRLDSKPKPKDGAYRAQNTSESTALARALCGLPALPAPKPLLMLPAPKVVGLLPEGGAIALPVPDKTAWELRQDLPPVVEIAADLSPMPVLSDIEQRQRRIAAVRSLNSKLKVA